MNNERSFTDKVYSVVERIPKGKIATYKQVAELAGSPRAARAVGTAMKNNPDTKKVPCHRVVGSDGGMNGYSAGNGIESKIKLLKEEGIKVINGRVNLDEFSI